MKLSELIKNLMEVYVAEGDKEVEIIRAGHAFDEIEIYNDGVTIWLEAYCEQDK